MRFVDSGGSQWEAERQWLPWRRKFRFRDQREGVSLFDGTNDLAGFVIALVSMVLMALPSLIEMVVQLVLLPFTALLRVAGLMRTPVLIHCTGKVVSSNDDGSKVVRTSGGLESWTVPVPGFRRAGLLREAVVEFVQEHGRSADVERFASDHLAGR